VPDGAVHHSVIARVRRASARRRRDGVMSAVEGLPVVWSPMGGSWPAPDHPFTRW